MLAEFLSVTLPRSRRQLSDGGDGQHVVVLNGVLLVDYTNELRRHRLPLLEAVPRAGRIHLRPILMTVLTTVVGLLPMALALAVGTEANQPLAIAVIGGLLVSTFFTLVLIPTLYVIFEQRFPPDHDGPRSGPRRSLRLRDRAPGAAAPSASIGVYFDGSLGNVSRQGIDADVSLSCRRHR